MQKRASIFGLAVALLPGALLSIALITTNDPANAYNPFGGVAEPAYNLLGHPASNLVLHNQYLIGLAILLLCLLIAASLYYGRGLGCNCAVAFFLLLTLAIFLGLPTHDREVASGGPVFYPFIVGFLLLPNAIGALMGKLVKKYLLKRFENKKVGE